MKKLVAYSSVSHLGFVVLGIFSFTQIGLDGAVYQMLNHGISTGALFILVGYMYERRHSLEIADYGGVATPAPNLAVVFLITTLASLGLPLAEQLRGRVPGAPGRRAGELRPGRCSRPSASSSRPATCCGCTSGRFLGEAGEAVQVAHARPDRPRVGGHPAADRPDGVDGRRLRRPSCRRSARPTRASWSAPSRESSST